MSFHRLFDDAGPLRPAGAGTAGDHEHRPGRGTRLGTGTLACPACDAPVSPGPHRLAPAAPLACPFCGNTGAVRDFLTLGAPTRPAHVVVKVTTPAGIRIHARRD
jgi:hypothetical protein